MSTAVRKQAPRPARPAARYWKGKAPKGVTEVESDSDEEDVREELDDGADVPLEFAGADEDDESVLKGERGPVSGKVISVALRDVNISRDGKVIVAGREESGRTAMEVDEEEEDESDEGEPEPKAQVRVKVEQDAESNEESGSDDEEESEEEEKPQLLFRPVFVPKRARVTVAERDAMAHHSAEALQKKEAEAEERRRESHNLVAESIRRELAEKEKEEIVPDVDDTDGVDPDAEFEAWRLRELGRIKRDKEAEIQRQEELEEIERRRAMPEEERLREDLARAEKLRAEKPKGQQKFLQKYWHKGAFHQDQEILQKRDYTEATESTVDVTMLPKVMQVKNFGKRSRTKYTHLLDQDTTVASGGFGAVGQVKPGAGGKPNDTTGCFLCGGPHMKRDCPQNIAPKASGANTEPVQPRSWNTTPAEPNSWRDRDGDSGAQRPEPVRRREGGDDRYGRKDEYRRRPDERESRYRRRSYSRSRSRSRSPPSHRRSQADRGDRRRSRSVDRGYREKRRRLD